MLNYRQVNVTAQLYEAVNGKPLPANTKLSQSDSLYSLSGEAPANLWAYVPSFNNASYVLPKWGVEICKLLSLHLPLYLYGGAGTGKSSIIRWIASTFSLPLYEVTAHNRLESPELIGSYQLINGETVWQDGPLTKAVRNGGIFLINEISLLDPSTATGLNTILDGQALLIAETSEVVPQHDAFYFVATDNTNGQGDASGLFLGTLAQNQALMSRFVLKEVSYLPSAVEAAVIKKAAPTLPDSTIDLLVRYASDNRASLNNSSSPLSNPLTPRDLIKWAKLILVYRPLQPQLEAGGKSLLKYTLDLAYINRLNAGDKLIAEELYHVIFGAKP